MEVPRKFVSVAVAAGVGAGIVAGSPDQVDREVLAKGGIIEPARIYLPSAVNAAELTFKSPETSPPKPTPGPEAYALCNESENQTSNGLTTEKTKRRFDERGRVFRRRSWYPASEIMKIDEIVYFEDGVSVRPIPEKPENFEGTFYINYEFYEKDRLVRVDHDVTVIDGKTVAVESSDYYIYSDEGLLVRQERETKYRAREPVVEYKYDDKDRLVEKKERYNPQDKSWGVVWHYTWHETADVVVRTVREGVRPHIVDHKYNKYGQVVQEATYRPNGSIIFLTEYLYDENGWLAQIKELKRDFLSNNFIGPFTTSMKYDNEGRVIQIIYSGSFVTQTDISRENCQIP